MKNIKTQSSSESFVKETIQPISVSFRQLQFNLRTMSAIPTPTCPKLMRPGCDMLPGCPMTVLSRKFSTRQAVIDENS